MQDHLGPCDLYLTNLVKDHQAMLHTEFQASKPNGFQEVFLIFFHIFL